jgi:hypothetical protein
LKLKPYGKYIFFHTFIACTVLLSVNVTNRDDNKLQVKSSRIIIKSYEVEPIPNTTQTTKDEGTPEIITNDSLAVQTLPIPNTNVTIIVNPLK